MENDTLLASVRAAAGGATSDSASHLDLAPAVAKAREEGRAAGLAEGAKAERERCAAILGSEAAKERGDLAGYFAFKTDMSVEAATGALDMAPKAAAGKPTLADRMAADRSAAAAAAASRTAPEAGAAHAPTLSSTDIYARRRAAAAGH